MTTVQTESLNEVFAWRAFFMTDVHSLTIAQVPLDTLQPDPANPRVISKAELEALERSLRQYGFVQPVIARTEDHIVIAGHQRLTVARRLGMSHVPVIWVDLPSPRARALGLALNRISGDWDEQLLARLLGELSAIPEIDLATSGFAESDVAALLRQMESREKRDRPETFDLETAFGRATREPRTKPGDLWSLGRHRLLCGDATRGDDVARVLDGGKADLAFTDPPYGVDLGRHGGQRPTTLRRTMSNDDLPAAEWERFVRSWAEPLLSSTDGAIYVCMGSRHWPSFARALAELDAHWSDTVVWTKDRFVIGRADYQHGYELLWYGWREGASHHWSGSRGESDVWQIKRPSDAPLHPVMKPLELIERAIANSSLPDALVLDPFLGSGSTLIACERMGRRCAAIELDPVYVDVAVARWERFSGGAAVLAGNGALGAGTNSSASDGAGRS
jgi:DNA modification methylase